jgi:hypothetical protein
LTGSTSVITNVVLTAEERAKNSQELAAVRDHLKRLSQERDSLVSAEELSEEERERRLDDLVRKIKISQDYIATYQINADIDQQMKADAHAIQQCINRALEKLRDPLNGCQDVAEEIDTHLTRESYRWKYEPMPDSPGWQLFSE